jgi:hypothetical protein
MSTFHQGKIREIFQDAQESPKKYIRISYLASSKALAIKGTSYPIAKALLVYRNGNHTLTAGTDYDDTRFALICRPKRHMALIAVQNATTHYSLVNLKDDDAEQGQEFQNPDSLICVVETEYKETFVLAFTKGLYFLQTFDSDQDETLYGVFQSVLACNKNLKEADLHEQEEDAQVYGV